MDRRAFLKMLGTGAAVTVAPTYFFAPVGGWHSDVIEHPCALRQANGKQLEEARVALFNLDGGILPAGNNIYLHGIRYYYMQSVPPYLGVKRRRV